MTTIKKISAVAGALMLALSISAAAETAPAPAAVTTAAADDAVFQSLGGKPGIGKFVDDFIPIVLADKRISAAFENTDTKRLAVLLKEQFCQLTGGPCVYSGRDMHDAHKDMETTVAHFNALAEDLQTAMDMNNVPSSVQNKLIAKLAPMEKTIVTK